MKLTTYHVLHLSSIIVLLAYTFYAFAAPAETRKRVVMITGVAALLTFISGFAMLGKLHLGFPGWVAVKLVCWLGLSVMVSFATAGAPRPMRSCSSPWFSRSRPWRWSSSGRSDGT